MSDSYFEIVFSPEDRLFPAFPQDFNRRLVDNLDPTHQEQASILRLRRLSTHEFSDACVICHETINPENDDEPFCCTRCTGKSCKSCFKVYLETTIKESKESVLCCSLCKESITKETAIRFVGLQMYRNYQYYSVSRILGKDSKTVWCPKDDCRNLLAHRGEPARKGFTIAQCRDCSTNVCIKCGIERDENHRCFCNSRTNKVQNVLSWIWKKVHCRKCPCCHIPIEKTKGHSHMFCAHCNVNFCCACKQINKANEDPHNATRHRCNARRNIHCI